MFGRIAIVFVVFITASLATRGQQLQQTRSISETLVVAVQATRTADVVLIGAGFEAGLRQGMVLSIAHAGEKIAEVILVDLRPRAGAAFITFLKPGHSIRSGDTATVKTLKV